MKKLIGFSLVAVCTLVASASVASAQGPALPDLRISVSPLLPNTFFSSLRPVMKKGNRVYVMVHNAGKATAPACTVRVTAYGNINGQSQLLGFQQVDTPVIKAGRYAMVNVQYPVGLAPGIKVTNIRLVAVVDFGNRVRESRENNNTYTINVK